MAEKKREKRNQKHGTDKKQKPVRWEYDILIKDFIPRAAPRPVPQVGIFDEDIYCLRFNELWLPHILGALQLLLEPDSWSGGNAEIFRAQQSIYLMLANMTEPCGEGNMQTPEFRSIVIDENCDQLQWKFVDEPESAWNNLGTPLCDGEDGDDGAPGTPGEDGDDGAPGTPGAPGEDCDCTDPVPPQPPITENDHCQQSCNIAMGLGEWMHGKFNDTLNWAEAAFAATSIIADLVGDFIDAFPIFGAVVDAVQDYVTGLGQFDLDALQGANSNEFKEMVQCKLFCLMADDTGDFTAEYLNGIREELQSWALALPPQGPLLVVIGQAFATFLGTISTNELLRRANVYKTSDANCDLCEDCSCVLASERLVSFEIATSNASEGTLPHIVKLLLTTPDALPLDVTVSVVSDNGTAVAPGDFLLLTTTATFPAGSVDGATQDVEVNVFTDAESDDAETFTLRLLSTVTGPAVIDTDNDEHVVTIDDCTGDTDTINCGTNNTFIPGDWDVCGAGNITSYDYEQITVTLPASRLIKSITVNWRSAFSPSAPIDDGIITIGGTPYTQNITGTGNSTSPQTVDDLMVTASSFTIETTGTVNGEHPAGYCAFFSIIVEYCD
jgi:hypothetical protein